MSIVIKDFRCHSVVHIGVCVDEERERVNSVRMKRKKTVGACMFFCIFAPAQHLTQAVSF